MHQIAGNASKISNVPRGHAFRPPGAHTCDERTASLSPTPHAPPPFPKSWIRGWSLLFCYVCYHWETVDLLVDGIHLTAWQAVPV